MSVDTNVTDKDCTMLTNRELTDKLRVKFSHAFGRNLLVDCTNVSFKAKNSNSGAVVEMTFYRSDNAGNFSAVAKTSVEVDTLLKMML